MRLFCLSVFLFLAGVLLCEDTFPPTPSVSVSPCPISNWTRPPRIPRCSRYYNCPPGAVCYDDDGPDDDDDPCLCRVGHLWSDNFSHCTALTCHSDGDCLPWPNTYCNLHSWTCLCDVSHRLEEGGLVCSITVLNFTKRFIAWEVLFIGLLLLGAFALCICRESRQQSRMVDLLYQQVIQRINKRKLEAEKGQGGQHPEMDL